MSVRSPGRGVSPAPPQIHIHQVQHGSDYEGRPIQKRMRLSENWNSQRSAPAWQEAGNNQLTGESCHDQHSLPPGLLPRPHSAQPSLFVNHLNLGVQYQSENRRSSMSGPCENVCASFAGQFLSSGQNQSSSFNPLHTSLNQHTSSPNLHTSSQNHENPSTNLHASTSSNNPNPNYHLAQQQQSFAEHPHHHNSSPHISAGSTHPSRQQLVQEQGQDMEEGGEVWQDIVRQLAVSQT